ncbi:MAG: dUTP diphosphatase [Candidatus Obscuribacter sp.]|jgi:dUTP pyrophosphatase|nr:dUTP diphosphatase [Candidatus Obscuribacter sp.]MBP6594016.1 dUTP diphosphatase [Candidatus Obscuribacter sp.]MBP7576411.1 dUTP diphosphatase [Candidatus Obscuribacter sp.]
MVEIAEKTQEQMIVKLKVKKLPHCHALPTYATGGSAGMDLTAAIKEPVTLKAGARMRVPCGICLDIPSGFEGQVRPRSGLADKAGISLTNCVGTIDSDYRGEVQVLAINHGDKDYTFEPGERVAQLVIMPVPKVEIEVVEELSDSHERGEGGFGSTGRQTLRA